MKETIKNCIKKTVKVIFSVETLILIITLSLGLGCSMIITVLCDKDDIDQSVYRERVKEGHLDAKILDYARTPDYIGKVKRCEMDFIHHRDEYNRLVSKGGDSVKLSSVRNKMQVVLDSLDYILEEMYANRYGELDYSEYSGETNEYMSAVCEFRKADGSYIKDVVLFKNNYKNPTLLSKVREEYEVLYERLSASLYEVENHQTDTIKH